MAKQHTDEQLERKIARVGPTKEKADLMLELAERIFHSDIERARTLHQGALELASRLKHHRAIANANSAIASDLLRSRLHLEAVPHAEAALTVFRSLRDVRGEATALRLLGEARVTAGNYAKAGTLLHEALELQIADRDIDGQARTRASLGYLFKMSAATDDAYRELGISRDLFDGIGNVREAIEVRNAIAGLEAERGNYAGALAALEELVPLRMELGDHAGLASTYSGIGSQYAMFAEYDLALEHFIKALELREIHGVGKRDYAFSNIAYVYSKLGKLAEAEKYYRSALGIAEARGDRAEMASYLSNIASVYSKMFDSERAIDHAQRSIEISRELGRLHEATGAFSNLAAVYRTQGRFDLALDAMEQAVAGARVAQNEERLAEHLWALATVRNDLRDVDGAIEAANESLERALANGRTLLQSEVYELLSNIHAQRGDNATALEMHRLCYAAYSDAIDQQSMHKLQSLTVQFDVERLRKDAEIERLKAERITSELEMKQKELSLMALHLVNKNEFLIDLRKQIGENVTATNDFIKELVRRIDNGIESDRDWTEFEQNFTQTNPDFSAQLMAKSGGRLSPTELKVCALLRTGLSTKEIANVLHVSTRTIDSHRYNIHRKLGLGDTKLVAFLVSIV